jgi:hypothetical protein
LELENKDQLDYKVLQAFKGKMESLEAKEESAQQANKVRLEFLDQEARRETLELVLLNVGKQ